MSGHKILKQYNYGEQGPVQGIWICLSLQEDMPELQELVYGILILIQLYKEEIISEDDMQEILMDFVEIFWCRMNN